jgi:hypothetical protein
MYFAVARGAALLDRLRSRISDRDVVGESQLLGDLAMTITISIFSQFDWPGGFTWLRAGWRRLGFFRHKKPLVEVTALKPRFAHAQRLFGTHAYMGEVILNVYLKAKASRLRE